LTSAWRNSTWQWMTIMPHTCDFCLSRLYNNNNPNTKAKLVENMLFLGHMWKPTHLSTVWVHWGLSLAFSLECWLSERFCFCPHANFALRDFTTTTTLTRAKLVENTSNVKYGALPCRVPSQAEDCASIYMQVLLNSLIWLFLCFVFYSTYLN
jgi:hypothetical protein